MKKYTFSNDGPFFMRIWSGGWGGFALQVFISLPGWGQNHFFFCSAKEKAVLDSEKEKVDQWK